MLTIRTGLCHNSGRTRGQLPKGRYGMDNEWNNNEYLPPQPEHSIDPEYTPEYPDVTFFKESAVTMREENIFRGEIPAGEAPPKTAKQQKKAKQTRMSWFRKFLGSAMRGGAALAAATTLIANAASGDSSAGGRRIRELVYDFKEEAFAQPDDYTPDELTALWNSDPEAPHNYDYDHLIVIREPSCTNPGLSCYVCTDCGVQLFRQTTKAHEPAPPVAENRVEPDCTHDGSFDEVTLCEICGTEMSRIHRVLFAPGHTADEYVVENAVPPNCTENGSEDEVVYCAVCGEEISRTTVVLEALGHESGEPVIENVTEPGCEEEGSEDEVIYCTVCGEEISRTTVTLAALGHEGGEPVIENVTEPNCTGEGSEDEVIYCTVCGEELSRTTESTPALGHSYTSAVTAATCTERGYTTHTCSRCGSSYRDTYTAALGHSYTSRVTAATCTAQGYTTYTCSRCGNSYRGNTTAALGHSYADTVTAATCTAQGYTTHTCSRCGDSYRDSYTAALGHSYAAQVTDPTCTAQGYTTHTCSRCGDSYRDTYTAALGHTYTFGYLMSGDETPTACDRCGASGFTISLEDATHIRYTLTQDLLDQANAQGFYALEWGDVTACENNYYGEPGSAAVGFHDSDSATVTGTSGVIHLDFTPVSGTTYYYTIYLRLASSGSSDDVYTAYPQGGPYRTYQQP